MTKRKVVKARTMMLTQQLDYLGMSVDELEERLSGIGAEQWALIVHDKDLGESGGLAAPHVHAAMYFRYPRSVSAVARKCGVKPQYVEKWSSGSASKDNAFSYLVHRTDGSRSRHQYDPGEVRASFDYASWLDKKSAQVERSRAPSSSGRKAAFVLDAVFDGDMTLEEAAEKLKGSEYARVARQLREADAYRREKEAQKWREANAGSPLSVVWVYGQAGVGKTRLAKEMASKRGPYFISGSSRDPWAGYSPDRHTVILDELRPGVLKYSDMLRIMDPYSIADGVRAPARYKDVPLACDLIVVTTPYDPFSFWRETVGELADVDGFIQLDRRLSLVLNVQTDRLCAVEVQGDGTYATVPGTERPNPYRSAAPSRSSKEAFTALFD